MKRDFALLDYSDGTSYLAELDHRFLRLDPLEPQGKSVRSRPTRELFNDLIRSIRPGEFDPRRKVLRWSDAFWDRPQKWASVLESMFEKPKADVFHTVSFDITDKQYQELRGDLARIKYQLLQGNSGEKSLGELYHIKKIWLTQRVVYNEGSSPRDGLTNGRLHMSASRSRRYMLMIQFGSLGDLSGYYHDQNHAQLRRQLYEKLDPRTKSLLDRLEEIRQKNDPDHRVDEQYEIIEDLAAHKIHRLDFFEDELIEHMVLSAPQDF